MEEGTLKGTSPSSPQLPLFSSLRPAPTLDRNSVCVYDYVYTRMQATHIQACVCPCVPECIYLCAYTCTCGPLWSYALLYMYALYASVFVCMNLNMHMFLYITVCIVCKFVCVCACLRACVLVCMTMYACVPMYTTVYCMPTYTPVCLCVHVCVCECTCKWGHAWMCSSQGKTLPEAVFLKGRGRNPWIRASG